MKKFYEILLTSGTVSGWCASNAIENSGYVRHQIKHVIPA